MKNRPQRQAAARSQAKCKAEAPIEDKPIFSDHEEEEEKIEKRSNKKSKESPSRPSKRQKQEQPSSSNDETRAAFESLPTIGRSKIQGRLSLLPTMPLDILVAVFSFLHPKDILSLARTTRTFRDVLMSRQATTVWKTAREGIGAPACPSLVSEPHWATLLSGHICQTCGTTNVQYVLLTLLRRACKSCTSTHLLSSKKLKKHYPKIDEVILELIPYRIDHRGGDKRYWDDDIESMSTKFTGLKINIRKRVPGAVAALEAFEKERKAAIGELAKLQSKWSQFIDKDRVAQWQEDRDIGQKRLQMVKTRLKELGYEDDDMHTLQRIPACTKRAELTDRAWITLRKDAEPEVILQRERRLERAQALLRQNRRELIDERFDAYRQTLPPPRWKYLPRTLDISFFEPFSTLVLADSTTEVTAASFDDAFKALPDLLEKADAELKDALRASLPEGKKTSRKGKGRAFTSKTTDPLDLAHSVFKCHRTERYCNYLIGWDAVASHHCLEEDSGLSDMPDIFSYDRPLAYMPTAAAFADQIIELAGLDPTTALAQDMDQLDLRFACYCDSETWTGMRATGYQWRIMVEHLTNHEKAWNHKRKVNAYLLSDVKAKDIKTRERAHSLWERPYWICGHCPEYNLRSQMQRTFVEAHLKEKHDIIKPVQGTDILYFTRTAPSAFFPLLKVEAEPRPQEEESDSKPDAMSTEDQQLKRHFLCLRCADAKTHGVRTKLFTVEDVQSHLLLRHQVPSPKKGLDYRMKSEDD
ncbi:hypothetical protein CPB83DRAFT_844980 [Crepidotus variabilis]|uniref:F-box domain-containing protein n=1 Tax=Crepidotus variabilis TaxID=179855 RepID=A0A9P6EQ77_9AGAR|nr:hypothetical protein CPB83DRAFT_844980 [Crepidotus variabilis]